VLNFVIKIDLLRHSSNN